jgi:hypothetical protein
MIRFLSIAVCGSLILVALAAKASACINDREIETQERYFKSSYIEKPAPEPSPAPSAPEGEEKLLVWGGIGAGAFLFLGAFGALTLGVPRKS